MGDRYLSYDIYLIPSEHCNFTKAQLRAYFEGRPNYEIEDEDRQRALYRNEDTGVVFSFDWADSGQSDDSGEPTPAPVVSFKLNLFRPSFFAIEAALEIDAALAHFQPTLYDLQSDATEQTLTAYPDFIANWNASNLWTHKAFLAQEDGRLPSLSTSKNEAMWRWNFGRKALSKALQALGEDVFVPRLTAVHMAGDNQLRPAAIWPNGVRFALPEPAEILILGETIKSKGPLGLPIGRRDERKEILGAVPVNDLPTRLPERLLDVDGRTTKVIDSDFHKRPKEVKELFKWAHRHANAIQAQILPDEIFDRETLEAARESLAREA